MCSISGKRVLIVEDNGLIGDMIADAVLDAGGSPIGPVMTEREAIDLIDYDPELPDAAILDVRLDGLTFGVASRLQSHGVPIIFATGHREEIPDTFRDVPLCQKPYTVRELLRSLSSVLSSERIATAAAA